MLQLVTAEIEAANIAYFQRKIQLSGFFFLRIRMACPTDEWNSTVIPPDARNFVWI